MAADTVLYLSPDSILADDNPRHGLKKSGIDALAADILASGGVNVPVEVEPLDPPVNGAKYRLTSGHYRYAAVSQLNAESNAGLSLPALVRVTSGPVERLKRQISENVRRESLSPMDEGHAIKRLLDAGVTKVEVRNIFARAGGRKGNTMQPASNAYVNMMLSFLELPKAVQEKIHDGRIGVAGAYELTKVPVDKRTEVLESIEESRVAAVEKAEREEEKFLKAEARMSKAQAEEESSIQELANAKAELELADKLAGERVSATQAAYKAAHSKKLDKDQAKKAREHHKSTEADSNAAVKLLSKARQRLEKAQKKAKSVAETLADNAAKLKAARDSKASAKAVGSGDVKKAAAAVGASAATVPLNAKEMREVAEELSRPGAYPTVQAIGAALFGCFKGEITTKELYTRLATIVGDRKSAKK